MTDATDIGFKTRLIRAGAWLLAWSRVHDVTAAIIGGLLVGYVLGKVL